MESPKNDEMPRSPELKARSGRFTAKSRNLSEGLEAVDSTITSILRYGLQTFKDSEKGLVSNDDIKEAKKVTGKANLAKVIDKYIMELEADDNYDEIVNLIDEKNEIINDLPKAFLGRVQIYRFVSYFRKWESESNRGFVGTVENYSTADEILASAIKHDQLPMKDERSLVEFVASFKLARLIILLKRRIDVKEAVLKVYALPNELLTEQTLQNIKPSKSFSAVENAIISTRIKLFEKTNADITKRYSTADAHNDLRIFVREQFIASLRLGFPKNLNADGDNLSKSTSVLKIKSASSTASAKVVVISSKSGQRASNVKARRTPVRVSSEHDDDSDFDTSLEDEDALLERPRAKKGGRIAKGIVKKSEKIISASDNGADSDITLSDIEDMDLLLAVQSRPKKVKNNKDKDKKEDKKDSVKVSATAAKKHASSSGTLAAMKSAIPRATNVATTKAAIPKVVTPKAASLKDATKIFVTPKAATPKSATTKVLSPKVTTPQRIPSSPASTSLVLPKPLFFSPKKSSRMPIESLSDSDSDSSLEVNNDSIAYVLPGKRASMKSQKNIVKFKDQNSVASKGNSSKDQSADVGAEEEALLTKTTSRGLRRAKKSAKKTFEDPLISIIKKPAATKVINFDQPIEKGVTGTWITPQSSPAKRGSTKRKSSEPSSAVESDDIDRGDDGKASNSPAKRRSKTKGKSDDNDAVPLQPATGVRTVSGPIMPVEKPASAVKKVTPRKLTQKKDTKVAKPIKTFNKEKASPGIKGKSDDDFIVRSGDEAEDDQEDEVGADKRDDEEAEKDKDDHKSETTDGSEILEGSEAEQAVKGEREKGKLRVIRNSVHYHRPKSFSPTQRLNGRVKRRMWSAEELKYLTKGMKRFGVDWMGIKLLYGGPGYPLEIRTPVDLKDKARNERNRRENSGLALGPFRYTNGYRRPEANEEKSPSGKRHIPEFWNNTNDDIESDDEDVQAKASASKKRERSDSPVTANFEAMVDELEDEVELGRLAARIAARLEESRQTKKNKDSCK